MPTPQFWCDPHLRGVKRLLSTYEKSDLLVNSGRALVMPGEPPTRPGDISEINELITVGFDPHKIYGVEKDPTLADSLYRHFYDLCPIHLEEVGEFLRLCQGTFCYIHLDFFGCLKPEEFESIQCWMGKVDPITRVRLSVVNTKRKATQNEYEDSLRRTMLLPLFDSALTHATVEPEYWADLWKRYSESDDPIHLLGAIMFYNFFFGIDPRFYADAYTENGPHIPAVKGKHRLSNVHRFTYRETGGGYDMVTIWADLVPLLAPHEEQRKSWVLGEMNQFFSILVDPTPKFVPTLFQEG